MPAKTATTASLMDLVVGLLKSHPEQEFASKELAEMILVSEPEWCAKKLLNSKPGVKLIEQIPNEISSRRPLWLQRLPQLQCTDTSPRKFSWHALPSAYSDEEVATSVMAPDVKLLEADLYPILAHFLRASPDQNPVYPKRIDEKTSSNKLGPKANEWLHPDMVGLENLMSGWTSQIQECAELAGDQRARLWSFEVKLRVTRSSVRRDYFQAVSNSSWAHFGYLVAAQVDPDAAPELKMLHGLHGIGLMVLNTENPAESEVRIPARARPVTDWVAANRLAEENKDFQNFTKLTRNYFKTGSISEKDWDIPKSYPIEE